MKNRFAKRGRPKYPDPFQRVECWIPKSMMLILNQESERLGVPVERLLVRAVCNNTQGYEIDMTLDNTLSTSVETQEILYDFITRAEVGIDLDLLILTYTEIGMTSMWQLKSALKTLIDRERVELFNGDSSAIPKVRSVELGKRVRRIERFKALAGEKTDLHWRKRLRKPKGVL